MNNTISGLPRLSGEYNVGYREAIMDIQEIFDYIQPDLKHHKKNLTYKLAKELLSYCLENRENIRENRLSGGKGFIRYNGTYGKFEWYEGK